MVLSSEELEKVTRLLQYLSESLEIAVREIVDRKIAEALDQHIEDYEHKEKPAAVEACL